MFPKSLIVVIAFAAVLAGSVFTLPAAASSGTLISTADTTLTADHVGNIVIGADNVTLNCAGHSVIGPGSGFGIFATSSGVTVTNCVVRGFELGIFLVGSSNSSVTNDTAFDNTNQGSR
jgi:parallel beta-helix repeat protein